MNYKILDEEVQKTYYYAKELLDSQGFTQKLGTYLALGQKNQPKEWNDLFLAGFMRPIIVLCLIAGITLMFKNVFIGISLIIAGILTSTYFGRKVYKYLNQPATIEASSCQRGSHKLMRIVADEMSKGSTMEMIVEALKKEIKDTSDHHY